jgi:hypothetical protein
MAKPYPYYVIWSGSLHLGDTPGVFMDAQFAGLLVQIPVTITFLPDGTDPIQFLLTTTEVEVFNDKRHPVYWDWTPGASLPAPVGYVDDRELIPGRPEMHPVTVPRAAVSLGKHWLTVHVNPEVDAGLRDDFVLERLEAHEAFGAKVGW